MIKVLRHPIFIIFFVFVFIVLSLGVFFSIVLSLHYKQNKNNSLLVIQNYLNNIYVNSPNALPWKGVSANQLDLKKMKYLIWWTYQYYKKNGEYYYFLVTTKYANFRFPHRVDFGTEYMYALVITGNYKDFFKDFPHYLSPYYYSLILQAYILQQKSKPMWQWSLPELEYITHYYNNENLNLLKSYLLIEHNQWQKALKEFQLLVQTQTNQTYILYILAFKLHQWDFLQKNLPSIHTAWSLLMQASVALILNKTQSAKQLLQQYIKAYPKGNAMPYCNLALLTDPKDYSSIQAYLEKGITLFSSDLYMNIIAYQLFSKYHDQKSIDALPLVRQSSLFFVFATSNFNSNNYMDYLESFWDSFYIHRYRLENYFFFIPYFLKYQWGEQLNNLVSYYHYNDPSIPYMRMFYDLFLAVKGDPQKSLDLLLKDQAVKFLYPQYYYYNLGMLYYLVHHYQNSINLFNQSLEQMLRHNLTKIQIKYIAYIYYYQALDWLELKERGQAKTALDLAYKYNPNNTKILLLKKKLQMGQE